MGSAGSTAGGGGDATNEVMSPINTDSRLPYPNFRDLFTLKNYWKTIRRNDKQCAVILMFT